MLTISDLGFGSEPIVCMGLVIPAFPVSTQCEVWTCSTLEPFQFQIRPAPRIGVGLGTGCANITTFTQDRTANDLTCTNTRPRQLGKHFGYSVNLINSQK